MDCTVQNSCLAPSLYTCSCIVHRTNTTCGMHAETSSKHDATLIIVHETVVPEFTIASSAIINKDVCLSEVS